VDVIAIFTKAHFTLFFAFFYPFGTNDRFSGTNRKLSDISIHFPTFFFNENSLKMWYNSQHHMPMPAEHFVLAWLLLLWYNKAIQEVWE